MIKIKSFFKVVIKIKEWKTENSSQDKFMNNVYAVYTHTHY